MQKYVFFFIVEAPSNYSKCFDVTKKHRLVPLTTPTATMRIVACSIVVDYVDEFLKIGTSIVLDC